MTILKHKYQNFVSGLETVLVIVLLFFSEDMNYPFTLFPNFLKYAFVGLLIALRWKRMLFFGTRDVLLIVLVVFAFLSGFWSSSPDISFDETPAMIRSTLFGVYLAARYTNEELMRLLCWFFSIAAIASLILAVGFPEIGQQITNNEMTWQGIYSHKQYLGRVMAVGASVFMFCALNSAKHRRILIAGFLLTLTVLILSKSKTSWAILILTLSMLPVYRLVLRNYKLRVVLFSLGVVILGNLAFFLTINLNYIITEVFQKPADFNGRFPIWTLAIQKGMEQPWLGYGYSGFWTSDAAKDVLTQTWARLVHNSRFHAHNGFVDLFVQLGLIGIALFLVQYFFTLRRSVDLLFMKKTLFSFFIVNFLIVKLCFNVTESITILSQNNLMWVLYSTFSVSTVAQLQRARREKLAERAGSSSFHHIAGYAPALNAADGSYNHPV